MAIKNKILYLYKINAVIFKLIEDDDKGNIVVNQSLRIISIIIFNLIEFVVDLSDTSEKELHSTQLILKQIFCNLKKYLPLHDPIYEAFQVIAPKIRYNIHSLSLFLDRIFKKICERI